MTNHTYDLFRFSTVYISYYYILICFIIITACMDEWMNFHHNNYVVVTTTGNKKHYIVKGKTCHQAKDAKGNLQPTIYVYEKDYFMLKLCVTRTINLSNTQFRYQLVFFVHTYGYI